MSNIDQQMGLRPLRSPYGTVPKITEYTRSSTGVIYEGAVLCKLAAGPAVYGANSASTTDHARDGIVILGTAAHHVVAAGTKVLVYDDPRQEFIVQADGNAVTTTAAALEAIGKYCNLVSHTTGNTTTLQAKVELDTSEITNTYSAHDVVKIVRLHTDPSNDVTEANEKWVVIFSPNVHLWSNNRTSAT